MKKAYFFPLLQDTCFPQKVIGWFVCPNVTLENRDEIWNMVMGCSRMKS